MLLRVSLTRQNTGGGGCDSQIYHAHRSVDGKGRHHGTYAEGVIRCLVGAKELRPDNISQS